MGNSLKRTIGISGSTGFIGKNLRSYFDKKNISYIRISRTTFQRKNPPLLSKCFCFVHLIGIGAETSEKNFQEINVELAKRAVEICKQSKIKKIIYFSGLGVSKDSKSNYFISKFNAEQVMINSGLDYTIFRPSYIIGQDDYLTTNIQKQIKQKKILIPGSGKYIIQPISINDVCKILHLASNSKIFSKKIIDLVGPEKIQFKQFLENSVSEYNVTIEKISVKKAYYNALSDQKFAYGNEDLNILLGNFQGNYKRLQKLSGIKFTKIKSI